MDRAVRFVEPGQVSWPDVYRSADLFLTAHLDRKESSGASGMELPVVEAMACGLPVAATRAGVTAGMIHDDENGVLAEPGAHTKLGKAALDLLQSAERRTAYGEAARESVEARHDADRLAADLAEFLEVLLVRRLRRAEPLPPAAA